MAYGVKSVTVNGLALDVTSEPSFSTRTKKYDPIEVMCGTPAHSTKRLMPYCEVECLWPAGSKLKDFQGVTDVLVQLETEDGRTFFWDDAVEVSDTDNKPVEGKMTLRFESTNSGEL